MKRLENLYDITKRLCGMIEPTGESNTDITRLANLEDTIDLVERLTQDIIFVARNKESYEDSVKVIGLKADSFITEMRENVTSGRTFTETEISQLQSKIYAITGDGEVMRLFNELLGITNNFDWIKIESEANLPIETDNYFVFNELGVSMRGYDMQDHNHWDDITHYQPIIKPNDPLY